MLVTMKLAAVLLVWATLARLCQLHRVRRDTLSKDLPALQLRLSDLERQVPLDKVKTKMCLGGPGECHHACTTIYDASDDEQKRFDEWQRVREKKLFIENYDNGFPLLATILAILAGLIAVFI